MSQPIRVVVVDDHTLVRNGLRALLETLPDVKVIGEAAGGREALREIAERAPDVVLMDITMPDMNGLAATERVVREHPRVAVLMVSMHADREFVARALRAGARGYLLKDASRAELELAVRSVARGGTYLSPPVAKPVVADYLARGETTDDTFEHLSPRQREILQLIAEGHTTKEVAARLGVSVKTAETHRSLLMKRLEIHDVAGLVRYAIRVGIASASS
jgi:DNA-binding NarL/FixJ family response regulator